MDQFLEVETERAEGPNNDVRADAGAGGNVAAWVIDDDVVGGVADVLGGSKQGGFDEFVVKRRGWFFR